MPAVTTVVGTASDGAAALRLAEKLKIARSAAAMSQPTSFPARGSWGLSRQRYGGRGDRGGRSCWCALALACALSGGAAQAQAPAGHTGAVNDYFSALMEKARRHDYDNGQLTEVLAERMHGPSESAWWVNGIQIKMGLLGKVIGFSILALDISQMQTFDASQSATMLKTLTGGLGIALLTTAVGLFANMLLGAQLVRMDRCSDGILADSLEFAETHLAKLTHQDAK